MLSTLLQYPRRLAVLLAACLLFSGCSPSPAAPAGQTGAGSAEREASDINQADAAQSAEPVQSAEAADPAPSTKPLEATEPVEANDPAPPSEPIEKAEFVKPAETKPAAAPLEKRQTEETKQETPQLEPASKQEPSTKGNRTSPNPAGEGVPVSATPAAKQQQVETVSLSIVGDSQTGTILPETSVEWEEGDTVIDVLRRAAEEHNISLDSKGFKSMLYVEGIADLYEFDQGPKSGWVYRVNGGTPGKGAGSYKVEPGDRIEWLYTLDLGRDVDKGKENVGS